MRFRPCKSWHTLLLELIGHYDWLYSYAVVQSAWSHFILETLFFSNWCLVSRLHFSWAYYKKAAITCNIGGRADTADHGFNREPLRWSYWINHCLEKQRIPLKFAIEKGKGLELRVQRRWSRSHWLNQEDAYIWSK